MAGIESLDILIGSWRGRGIAKFPTIQTTDYVEELSFEKIGADPAIHYISKTWYLADGRQGGPLHWETGFLIATGEKEYILSNSQNNGRVEVLSGRLEVPDGKYHLTFVSKYFGNDPRMMKTDRVYVINGGELKYTMSMSTFKTPLHQQHLEAVLKKV